MTEPSLRLVLTKLNISFWANLNVRYPKVPGNCITDSSVPKVSGTAFKVSVPDVSLKLLADLPS